jgi:murein DD-endopeptidase MepM/ murein hydrolase activator NlpD
MTRPEVQCRPRVSPRVIAVALIAIGTASCSDSARFDTPYSNPFSTSRASAPETTGSISTRPAASSHVVSQPLPAPSRPATVAASGVSGGAGGLGAYRPSEQSAEVTGSVKQRREPAPAQPAGHWTWDGGTPVTVKHGETVDIIARKYGVPASALLQANNLSRGASLKPGQRLVIPRYTVASFEAHAAALHPEKMKPAPRVAEHKPPQVETVASVPAQTARVAKSEAVEPESPVKSASAMPSFRWPVRGRIISAFGAKPNGQQNDGINLAVPEGTPIKAAEDGVVAYAGNELKGYGNLVLIRHSNGYVSAYANASELLVKRGDTVKRGQVIAHAGQTGNVSSPQLHFEIRKGSVPVDPTQFLGNNG